MSLGRGGCAPLRFIHPLSSSSLFCSVTRSDVDPVAEGGALSPAQACHLQPAAVPRPPPRMQRRGRSKHLRAAVGRRSGPNALQGCGVAISPGVGVGPCFPTAPLLYISHLLPVTHAPGGRGNGRRGGWRDAPTHQEIRLFYGHAICPVLVEVTEGAKTC